MPRALLDGILDRLLAALLPAEDTEQRPWDARLTAFAHACREMAQRHPWTAELIFSRAAVSPDALRAVDFAYAVECAGPERAQVGAADQHLRRRFATSEASGRFAVGTLGQPHRRAQLPDSELSGHTRLGLWMDPADLTAEFEADLHEILRMIEAAANGPREDGCHPGSPTPAPST